MRVRQCDVFATEVDGETVLLLAEKSIYLTVNSVGTTVLRTLVDDVSEDEVVRVICEEYDVSADVALGDCRAFIDELRRHGLLIESDT